VLLSEKSIKTMKNKEKINLFDASKIFINFSKNKMSEMQKVSEVFKSNLNYHHRVEHKKLL
jgi:hypothetical protein